MFFLSHVMRKDNIFEGELAVSNYIINNIICLKTKCTYVTQTYSVCNVNIFQVVILYNIVFVFFLQTSMNDSFKNVVYFFFTYYHGL